MKWKGDDEIEDGVPWWPELRGGGDEDEGVGVSDSLVTFCFLCLKLWLLGLWMFWVVCYKLEIYVAGFEI